MFGSSELGSHLLALAVFIVLQQMSTWMESFLCDGWLLFKTWMKKQVPQTPWYLLQLSKKRCGLKQSMFSEKLSSYWRRTLFVQENLSFSMEKYFRFLPLCWDIPAPRKQRQEDHEFEASLNYVCRSQLKMQTKSNRKSKQ